MLIPFYNFAARVKMKLLIQWVEHHHETRSLRHMEACRGFNGETPVDAKSATFRVTTVMPNTSAVWAISTSRLARRPYQLEKSSR